MRLTLVASEKTMTSGFLGLAKLRAVDARVGLMHLSFEDSTLDRMVLTLLIVRYRSRLE